MSSQKKPAEIKILPSLSTIFSFLLEQRFLSCYTRAHVLTTRERAGNHGRRVEHLARKRKKKGSLKRERERERILLSRKDAEEKELENKSETRAPFGNRVMSSGNSTALLKISGSPEPGEALRAILIGSIPTFQQRKRASSNVKKKKKEKTKSSSSPNDDKERVDDAQKNHPQRSTFSTIEEEEEDKEEEEALVLEFQWF